MLQAAAADMKRPCLKAFAAAFILFIISILPILILSKGIYLSLGDYNVQSIPFSEHVSRLLHNGEGFPAIDWYSGLGMDHLLAYGGFFLSPFFWLLAAVPVSVMPYIHSLVVALKFGISAAGGVLYTRQYLKTNNTAFICGMLYAFSGYQIFNLAYQFIDVICLFPFLLYAFDKLVTERRPVAFAFILGINGFINCIFLWEECIFIAIYFFVRVLTKSYPKIDIKLFFMLALESVAGALAAGVSILPTAIAVADNPRAGSLVFDESILAYDEMGVIWHIIQSMIMPPEVMTTSWYFDDFQVSISNPALYIPLFSVIGVWAVLSRDKKSWYSVLVKVCGVILCIPLFNSVFSMFNSTFYARWLYMPLLVMILMTGMFLEDIESFDCKKQFYVIGGLLAVFLVAGIHSVYLKTNELEYSMKHYWIMSIFTAAAGAVITYLLKNPTKQLPFVCMKNVKTLTCVICLLISLERSVAVAESHSFRFTDQYIRGIWNNFEPVDLHDEGYFRISSTQDYNCGMQWGYPSIDIFNTMIPGSETSFYEVLGKKRYQGTKLSYEDYAVRSFLSVKYLLCCNIPLKGDIEVDPKDYYMDMEGFDDLTVHNSYLAYKNSAFIPIGFTYDYYLDLNEAAPELLSGNVGFMEVDGLLGAEGENINSAERQKLLLKAIWLTEEQTEKYKDILSPLPDELKEDTSVEAYYRDCRDRAAASCVSFVPDSSGFEAETDFDNAELVFFSVPYLEGYTAYVDGEKTVIENVFNGLTAVYVPAGHHMIRYEYKTPGLYYGTVITLTSVGAVAVYGIAIGLGRAVNKKKKQGTDKGE